MLETADSGRATNEVVGVSSGLGDARAPLDINILIPICFRESNYLRGLGLGGSVLCWVVQDACDRDGYYLKLVRP